MYEWRDIVEAFQHGVEVGSGECSDDEREPILGEMDGIGGERMFYAVFPCCVGKRQAFECVNENRFAGFVIEAEIACIERFKVNEPATD